MRLEGDEGSDGKLLRMRLEGDEGDEGVFWKVAPDEVRG